MKVFRNLSDPDADLQGSVLTIGNFDGVHLGHQALLGHLVDEAHRLGSKSVVMTFDPHPVQVLYPERSLSRLFSRGDLVERLGLLGLDALVVQAFSREFSQLSAVEFVQRFILIPFRPVKLVVGYDFTFGANRSGNLQVLNELGLKFGFEVDVVEALKWKGEVVSSTRVRRLVTEGKVEEVKELLARPFYVQGMVEKGDQRGAGLGVRTANLKLMSETCPKTGVYITRLNVAGKSFPAVTNVGHVPTFIKDWSAQPRVETHVLRSDMDLYGQDVSVEFLQYLREEQKFSDAKALIAQIKRDIEAAEQYHGIQA